MNRRRTYPFTNKPRRNAHNSGLQTTNLINSGRDNKNISNKDNKESIYTYEQTENVPHLQTTQFAIRKTLT